MFTSARVTSLLFIFFASGAAGLVYEVVWMRLLSLTLSVTVYAVSTVLCAFMAGLAIGAAIAGRMAERMSRPLFTYGVIEVVLGVIALATPGVLIHLQSVYSWIFDATGSTGLTFVLLRFLLAFIVLVVPSTLMGTTLPLLSKALIDRESAVGRGAGTLYAVNTLGAVTGCIAAGFLLIPNLGLSSTNMLAATTSIAAGLAAMAMSRQTGEHAAAVRPARAQRTTTPRATAPHIGFAYGAIAISGFTALGYEVLWTRALEQFTHNSTYAYTAMLATFLIGIGVGSAVAAGWADRLKRPLFALGVVELLVAVSVVVSLFVYSNLDRIIPTLVGAAGGVGSWVRVILLIFVEASSVLLVTTFLFGVTFPLVARAVVDDVGTVASRIASAYAWNTLGSIIGSLIVGFVAIPALGLVGSFYLLAAVNLALALALTWRFAEQRARWMTAGASALVAVVALLWIPIDLFRDSYQRRYGELLFYKEEVTDTVMVTENDKGHRMIRYGDGRGTAGNISVIEDRMYAQIPLLLHPHPLRVLNICFGVGNSLSSVLTHPVEHVDSVELSPGVIGAAPFFADTNRDVLADPRIQMTIADGRNFLLTTDRKYDIIRLDPPELHTAGIVNLYTKEFLELARDHLAPGGIFSVWVNVVMTPVEDLQHLTRTIASVFPHVSIWHGPARYSWVINGSMVPRDPDLTLLTQKFANPAVSEEMRSIGVDGPFSFLSHFVLSGEDVKGFAGDGPIVTDDHTILDFSVPRSLDSFYGIANANTDMWLEQYLGPVAGQSTALKRFFEKMAVMNGYKKPVLPHLLNVEAAGFTPEEVEKSVAASGRGERPEKQPS
jgi:spermidine synthase